MRRRRKRRRRLRISYSDYKFHVVSETSTFTRVVQAVESAVRSRDEIIVFVLAELDRIRHGRILRYVERVLEIVERSVAFEQETRRHVSAE